MLQLAHRCPALLAAGHSHNPALFALDAPCNRAELAGISPGIACATHGGKALAKFYLRTTRDKLHSTHWHLENIKRSTTGRRARCGEGMLREVAITACRERS